VTAGVDGDEYAGIEAAKELTATYRGDIPLTVIPTVNRAGNLAGVSWNPLDGRYPKHIFPGSPWGSSSSRLIHSLLLHLEGVELWLDLHGGASDEHLHPFVWTGHPYPRLGTLSLPLVITEPASLAPATYCKRHNLEYILVEAGELGHPDEESVQIHLETVHTLLTSLRETSFPPVRPTYHAVHFQKNLGTIPHDYLWYSPETIATGVW
jgi:hypothetical protein